MFHSYSERKDEKVLKFNIVHLPNFEISASSNYRGRLLEEMQYVEDFEKLGISLSRLHFDKEVELRYMATYKYSKMFKLKNWKIRLEKYL